MTINKVGSLLGIAQRAGFVTSGSNLILEEISRRRPVRNNWLILVAADAQSGTGTELIQKGLKADLPVYRIPLVKLELGLAIGKNQRSCVMIKDGGIAGRIMALLEEMEVQPLDQNTDL